MGRTPRWGMNLVGIMGLAGDVRDGKTLGERLLGTSALDNLRSSGELQGVISAEADTIPLELSDVLAIFHYIERLVSNVERGVLARGEEELANALAGVVTQQILREGDICPMAASLAERISRVRPDLVNPMIL